MAGKAMRATVERIGRMPRYNNTAGVREREDGSRTRVAGHLDEIQGVVAITLKLPRNGAGGCIVWLGLFGFGLHDKQQKCRRHRSEDRIVEGSFWT